MLERIRSCQKQVRIALVGKYVKLHDSYLSVAEALSHGGWENQAQAEIRWVDSEFLTEETLDSYLKDVDGILVPGGFGDRGVEGMILAASYARTHHIPYLGICLGMQIAAISFARDVLGFSDAHSREFSPNSLHPVIDLMPDQEGNLPKGGTMRLGSYPCCIQPGSHLEKAYGASSIQERHRHRYEFNNTYREAFEQQGACFSGLSPDKRLVEAMELPKEDFYVGVQYHPEFKSRPNKAHPLFRSFIEAALAKKEAFQK